MSAESVSSFVDQVVSKNAAVSQELASVGSPQLFAAKAVKLGKQHGFSFTPEDVWTYLAGKKFKLESASAASASILSDEELESVAGGKIDYSRERCPADTRFTYCVGISCCINSAC